MTRYEANEETVGMDAKMSFDMDDNLRPVQVSAMILNGEVLLQTFVIPKVQIRDYWTRIHGITENALRNGIDEREYIEKISEIERRKIITESDLYNNIKALKIDVKEL